MRVRFRQLISYQEKTYPADMGRNYNVTITSERRGHVVHCNNDVIIASCALWVAPAQTI